jgi:hypothetical protein
MLGTEKRLEPGKIVFSARELQLVVYSQSSRCSIATRNIMLQQKPEATSVTAVH